MSQIVPGLVERDIHHEAFRVAKRVTLKESL